MCKSIAMTQGPIGIVKDSKEQEHQTVLGRAIRSK